MRPSGSLFGRRILMYLYNTCKEEDEMEYTTQMDAARKGIVTKEMKKVAEK